MSPELHIILEEPAWPDLRGKLLAEQLIHITTPIGITALPHGMVGGAPSVAMRFDLPDGRTVVAETSLKLFLTAADIFKAKFGDPRI